MFCLKHLRKFTISILLNLKYCFKLENWYSKFQIFVTSESWKVMAIDPVFLYSRSTEDSFIPLRQTRFFLLKFRTFLFSSNWKLLDSPCPCTGACGGCDVVACFWTWAPFRPLGHLALLGDHTGLEGHGHFLLLAEAVTKHWYFYLGLTGSYKLSLLHSRIKQLGQFNC